MIRTPLPFAALSFLALAALGACSKPAEPAPPPAPAAAAQPAPAPAPAKPMKMVCRNSQTGADAKCGTPNAVMVGMQPE
ncbi:MAG: hypothetical protein JWO83_321 [Caulobacteraceae bacterium]|nr:hypothetical protein [Caulobacteraceae bacterium]